MPGGETKLPDAMSNCACLHQLESKSNEDPEQPTNKQTINKLKVIKKIKEGAKDLYIFKDFDKTGIQSLQFPTSLWREIQYMNSNYQNNQITIQNGY